MPVRIVQRLCGLFRVTKSKKASPFLSSHFIAWGFIIAASLVATLVSPSSLGPSMALPFCLGCTIYGYLIGNALPPAFQVTITLLVYNTWSSPSTWVRLREEHSEISRSQDV